VLDADVPPVVGMDRPAEAPASRGDAGQRLGTQAGALRQLPVGVPGLLHDVFPVRLLHGVVAVAMEHDHRHRLRGLATGRCRSSGHAPQARHPAAPALHRGHRRGDVVRTAKGQAGMGADAGKDLRVGLAQHHGHRGAGRESGHEDAARVGAVPPCDLADDAGDQRRLAATAGAGPAA
jgi:hypothetical protein